MKKRIVVNTLGCKVNQFESASFITSLENGGCVIVTEKEQADVVIINTCTVTNKAGAQSRQTVRRLVRNHPGAKVIITGCYAQMAADEFLAMDDLATTDFFVVGNSHKEELIDVVLHQDQTHPRVLLSDMRDQKSISRMHVKRFGARTRAFLRVQDGCNSYCTYCIVPYTRGPSRSLPLQEVLDQAYAFEAAGHKEIVITGIHVGLYGLDLAGDLDITSLLSALCQATPNIRYRLSSIEPLEVTEKLLQLMAHQQNFMPHLHIPLQSGHDEILAKMNRRYTTEQFARVIATCRNALPDCAIGIDVLAGFPGESEDQFKHAQSFLEKLDYTYLHVFPYSDRPGTVASSLDDKISTPVKNNRVAALRALGEEKKNAFYSRFAGTVRPVLVEGHRDRQGRLKGFSDNYIPVYLLGNDDIMDSIVNVRIDKIIGTEVFGEVVE